MLRGQEPGWSRSAHSASPQRAGHRWSDRSLLRGAMLCRVSLALADSWLCLAFGRHFTGDGRAWRAFIAGTVYRSNAVEIMAAGHDIHIAKRGRKQQFRIL